MTHESSVALIGSVASGVVAVCGFVGQSVGSMDLPWDKISGIGVGGVAIFLTWFFMRRDDLVRKEHHETTQKIVDTFAKTTDDVTTKFSETTTTLLRESREDMKDREAKLTALFAQFHKDKA